MSKSNQIMVSHDASESRPWLELVNEQVRSLSFGVVQITVHNSRVTQIDRTERTRLDTPTTSAISNPPDNWRE